MVLEACAGRCIVQRHNSTGMALSGERINIHVPDASFVL